MHIGWFGGQLVEEYTVGVGPSGCEDLFSVIRPVASFEKTAPVSAGSSRSPRPRMSTRPCSATTARSASRCAAAQPAAPPVTSARRSGGLPGCSSTSTIDAVEVDDISISFP